MSRGERLRELIEAGERERARLVVSTERTGYCAGQAAQAGLSTVGRAVQGLKWAGLALAAAGALWRWTGVRRGWRVARWVWALAPGTLATVASHFFGRRNPQKRK